MVSKMARILVIDDAAAVRELLEQMLRLAGHEVLLAGNGKEGLDLLRRQPVELVITDLFMPEKEGLETIQELHRDFSNLPVIAMSGEPGMPSLLGIAKRFGAVKTIEKPFDRTEMMAAIDEALRSSPPRA
jgi:two-component system response regulator (stage 0 sporulation protein F)